MTTHAQHTAGTPCWLDLMTSDLELVRPFYQALFGWTFEGGSPEFGGYQTAHLDGGAVGGVMPMQAGDASPVAWGVYFASDDAAADARRIRDLGGQVEVDAMPVADHGQMVLGRDPTGAAFALWQAGRHPGMTLSGVPGAFAWAELHTRDAAQARDFYTALLNKASCPVPEMNYHILLQGQQQSAGIMQMDDVHWPPEASPAWMVYFEVADTGETVRQAGAHGGRVVAAPHASPYGRITVLQDPAGATFSLIEPAPSASK